MNARKIAVDQVLDRFCILSRPWPQYPIWVWQPYQKLSKEN